MSKVKNVVIGIQARLTNTRLPGKVRMLIAGVSMLDRVIINAKKSAAYINNMKNKDLDIRVSVALLVPEGDELAEQYRHEIMTIEGPENDVLKRYFIATKVLEPDYIVRITSDCPLIPPFVITKHIANACNYDYDYISNTHHELRTAPDGFDCEVLSKRMMHWLNEVATDPFDREHVTTFLRENKPEWARSANVIGYTDLSQLKLSVDTEEDLFFVRTYYEILTKKVRAAQNTGDGFFRL